MNVHILSDSPRGTSAYASITRNLAHGLAGRGHNVTVTGFQTYFAPEDHAGIKVFPLLNPLEPNNPHLDQFVKNLKKSKAEALICIFQADSHFNIYSQMFNPVYFWVPVEGKGLPANMSSDLKAPNIRVVSQSHAGKKELASEGIECPVIYPGWNPQVFTRNPEPYCKWSTELHRQTQDPAVSCMLGCWKCKGTKEGCNNFEEEQVMINYGGKEFSGNMSSLRKLRENLGADFVVGCVATNMGLRKRIERLIEGFSLFHNKGSLLHIHTSLTSHGVPLLEIAKKFNVFDRVVLSYGEYPFGVSDRGMNQIYNCFDIHATASGAEGFGMTHLESEGCGIPQVAPHFGTFPELLGENERGLLANVAATQMIENGTVRCLVDVESLADKMNALYIAPWLRKKMGNDAAEWAKQFTWDKVVLQWDKLLTEGEEKLRIAQRVG